LAHVLVVAWPSSGSAIYAAPSGAFEARDGAPRDEATLIGLVAEVAGVLERESVEFWVSPGAALVSAREAMEMGPRNCEEHKLEFSASHEALDLGVWQDDTPKLLLAALDLRINRRIHAIETHFGMRFFYADEAGIEADFTENISDSFRYEFRVPFVDLDFHRRELLQLGGDPPGQSECAVSYCCDCDPVLVSTCTKKLCGCRVCWHPLRELFPLQRASLRAASVLGSNRAERVSLRVPRKLELVLLPRHADDAVIARDFHQVRWQH